MTTPSLSTCPDQAFHTIVDRYGQTHTLERNNEILLIDGCPATVSINEQEVRLTTGGGTVTVAAQAFWYAFAGGAEPSATEAGLLLADGLMRAQAFQHLRQVQTAFQQAYEHIQSLDFVPLPTYRLNPFIEQALDAYDGTEATSKLLARVLKQDQAIIEHWAKLLGKHRSAPLAASKNDQVQKPEEPQQTTRPDTCSHETPDEKPNGKRFRWTSDLERQLAQAFHESTASTVTAIIQDIAQRYHWPANAVQYKLYELQLPQQKQQQAHQREGQQAQEDHPSTANSSPEIHLAENGAADVSRSEPSTSAL